MNIVDKILVDPITRGLKFFTKGGVPAYITQVRGRTDGSAAAAGEIGETFQDSGNTNTTSQNVNRLVTKRTLQPGIWMVQVNASIGPAGGTTSGGALAKIIVGGTDTAGIITGGTNSGTIGLDVAELDGTLASGTLYPLGSMTKIVTLAAATTIHTTVLAASVVSSYNSQATTTFVRVG
jgi:hypothetical protein